MCHKTDEIRKRQAFQHIDLALHAIGLMLCPDCAIEVLGRIERRARQLQEEAGEAVLTGKAEEK